MIRSLRRRVFQALDATPCVEASSDELDPAHVIVLRHRHRVEVEITFPRAAFADVPPSWSPGDDFTEVMGGAWLRTNMDGSQTAVVTGVGPKQLPALDGGVWTDEEVWTVTSHDRDVFAYLDDKPHRITWAAGRDDVTIVREPYPGHPYEAHEDYWCAFYLRHRFTPELGEDGRYRLLLASMPNALDYRSNVLALADAASRVLKALGGRATVRCAEREVDPDRFWVRPQEVELTHVLASLRNRF